MKRLIFSIFALVLALPLLSQNPLNNDAANIVGDYYAIQSGNESKVRIFLAEDGTYTGQIFWVKDSVDPATGKKYGDPKNPDKSLRSVPCDQIVLFKGLKYNPGKKQWDSGKIYDPTRGIRANCTVCFAPDGRLKIRGSVMGIGETVYWKKL
ncbi:MAG: DUF2147 domain-containing protein [Bacteroidales bacterium]|nr:DUF2147 domain-containing protein [Bacteroidales bacterium]